MPKARKRKARKLTPRQESEHVQSLRERVHAARRQWAKGFDALAAYQQRLHAQKLA